MSRYVGGELELFAEAHRWKRYFARQIAPFVGATVLEVGAGIGGTTLAFDPASRKAWVCLEPDPDLARRLALRVEAGELPRTCSVRCGTVRDVEETFDTVLYVDVLEHIEDDAGELSEAARRLAPGGHLVVLSPAHPWLFSPFDESVGHHRRYTRRSLAAVGPADLELERLRYLDSVGVLASAANRLLLRQRMPTTREIASWDRVLVPASRYLDPLLRYRAGKSVLAVWRRSA